MCIHVHLFHLDSYVFNKCSTNSGDQLTVKMSDKRENSVDEKLETKEKDNRSLIPDNQAQDERYVHKVGVPPKQKLYKEIKSAVKETFFPDDPLRSFKDQTKKRKFILGIQAVFPILDWGRTYNLTKFRGDVISGLTIASLCIPQV